MTGFTSRKPLAERYAALRIPDEIACPGSGSELVRGHCVICAQSMRGHYPERRAQRHKAPAWMLEMGETRRRHQAGLMKPPPRRGTITEMTDYERSK